MVGLLTGTNLWGAFWSLVEMVVSGRSGSVVTLLADSGYCYADTDFCEEWLSSHGLESSEWTEVLVEFERSGRWP